MQAFVASLTAALLFIHTVCGCCWHHARCSTATVSESAHCCHHHQHSSDSKPDNTNQRQKPCKCNVECEGACTYVAPQKVKVESPQWLTIDVPMLSSLAACQFEGAALRQFVSPLADWSPPLRTHLLHQVLLN